LLQQFLKVFLDIQAFWLKPNLLKKLNVFIGLREGNEQ